MNASKKAEHLATYFVSKTRDNGTEFVYLSEEAPQTLRDAVKEAHEDVLPNDWVYGTFADLLQKISEYNCETVDEIDDEYRHEIVDGCVDIYTHDLTAWLHENQALSYLEDACEGFVKEDGAWQLLARAQYLAIDEIMRNVIESLK